MSIRLKISLILSSLMILSLFFMGIVILHIQRTQMIDNLKQSMISNSQQTLNMIQNPGPPPGQRGENPPPDNNHGILSQQGKETPDSAAQNSTPPANNEGQNMPPQANGYDRNMPPPADEGRTNIPLSERSQEDFTNLFKDSGKPIFDIVNILDTDGSLVFNPIQRNSQVIPITAENFEKIQTKETVWQTCDVGNLPFMVLISPIINNDGDLDGFIEIGRPLDSVNQFLATLLKVIIKVGLVEIVFSAILSWFISGIVLRIISNITQTANEIRSEHDYSKRVEYHGPQDEIGRLVGSFNGMLDTIQENYTNLEQSLQQQHNFVADVSHELRTPLTTIRGNLALLSSGKKISETDQQEMLQDMTEETDRLTNLVNELLTLARADIEKKLFLRPTNVKPIVADAVRQLSVLDPQRKVTLDIPDDFTVLAEKEKLKQIVIILVDNAYKHSTSDIEISGIEENGMKKILVIDHGEGIAKADIHSIFDRFKRLENQKNCFGLGLPIALAIAKSLNGTIDVESSPYVRTCFSIVLPGTENAFIESV